MEFQITPLQKRMYDYLKSRATKLLGQQQGGLKRYYLDQTYYFSRPFYAAKFPELFHSIDNSELIFLGDFHTFDQNIVNATRLLKRLCQSSRNPVLGLEMVSVEHQSHLDAFMDGQLTEFEFLESIHYHESWRFPWPHYRKILELAKNQGMKVRALNSQGSLVKRDETAAKIIVELLETSKDRPVIIFFGELHILPNKIPRLVLERLKNSIRYTIVHQNNDQLFWRQQEHKRWSELMAFSPHEYCLQTSPPWIKYESFLYWYESMAEDPDFDLHEQIFESGVKALSSDTNEHFYFILRELSDLMGFNFSQEDLKDFNLKDYYDLERVKDIAEENYNKGWQKFLLKLIEKNESFKMPGLNTYYCPQYSFNRLITLAGMHLVALLNPAMDSVEFRLTKVSDFFVSYVYQNSLSYFFSKFFNPHRKCDLYMDLKGKAESKRTYKNYRKQILYALSILEEKAYPSVLFKEGLLFNYGVAKILGKLLGEYLYRQQLDPANQLSAEVFRESLLPEVPSLETLSKKIGQVLKSDSFLTERKRFF